MYIYKYYESLYKKEKFSENVQNWFLGFVEKKLDENDCKILESNVNDKEIYEAIMDMKHNKSPGIDGLPIEFYCKFWSIIRPEICEIIKNMVNGTNLQENQRKAILVLIHKDGELSHLKNWRPISLICADVKVVAKILAKRLRNVMDKIVSKKQFCVQGRTIIDSTVNIRDIIYNSNEMNISGAVINLDWEKAFDRVDWSLLTKTMYKIGFPIKIANWINNLYNGIQSTCLVNGFLSKPFNIERGIRQGCPLSMIVYVLFQESLYNAIEKSNIILPPKTKGEGRKIIGYADDTSGFVKDDDGILELFHIINKFEMATNSKLNVRKTKIFGYGNWKGRTNWPIDEIKVEIDYFKTLGIIFSTDYKLSVDLTWNNIYHKISKRISLIKNRNFTLFQKACIINSLLASKIWYTAHVYPYSLEISKLINKEIYKFLWNSNTEFLSRDTVCNTKDNGGLGLINIVLKAKSIFIATTLRILVNSENNSLVRYYMYGNVNKFIKFETPPFEVSNVNTTYYEYAIENFKKICKLQKFPNVNSKEIYKEIKPKWQPKIENMYPMYKWDNIWKNLNFRYINIKDRNIMYKYIHEILTNNKKLYQMRIKISPNCDHCDIEDSNIHRFYQCHKVQKAVKWLKRFLEYISSMRFYSIIKLLSLEFPNLPKKIRSTLCLIICNFIATIWYNRENIDSIEEIIISRTLKEKEFIMSILKEKARDVLCKRYCEINRIKLNSFKYT